MLGGHPYKDLLLGPCFASGEAGLGAHEICDPGVAKRAMHVTPKVTMLASGALSRWRRERAPHFFIIINHWVE